MIAYEYASGPVIKSFDRILSTSPECKYSDYIYSLNVVTPSSETLVTLGITINNTKTPAEMTINQPNIGIDKTVTLEWSAIPVENPDQSPILK